jgi:3-oxoacyl-[acyl-carrier-protein] synthase-3
MHAYELNKHGRIVFPSNCFPDLDFSTFESLEQLDAFVRRDFDATAPVDHGSRVAHHTRWGRYGPGLRITALIRVAASFVPLGLGRRDRQ